MDYEKKVKVQFRKPVTIMANDVDFIEEIGLFKVVTDRGESLIHPTDIILIENINIPIERYQSNVRPPGEAIK